MRTMTLLFLLFCGFAEAKTRPIPKKTLTPKEMIAKAEAHLRGKTTQSAMRMVIERPSYTRKLTLRSWTDGNDKASVVILDPPKEEGIVSLRTKDQMWNYLPKADQTVRVPSSLMLQSWMGSDFTNDDLMKSSSLSRDYKHKFVKTEKIGKEKLILIECSPLSGAPVVWGKVLYWARANDYLPIKQVYFDEKKKVARTIYFTGFKKMDDRVVPTTIKVVKGSKGKEYTTITYTHLLYDRKLPNSQFEKETVRATSQNSKVITAGWFMNPGFRKSR